MSSFHQEEVYKSGNIGFFRPHSLITKIDSLADLSDDGESASSRVVALHVHEYIHYLHNLSTLSGLSYLTSSLLLMRPLIKQYESDVLGRTVDESMQKHYAMAFKQITLAKGHVNHVKKDYVWKRVKEWTFVKSTFEAPEVTPWGDDTDQGAVGFDITALFYDNVELDFFLLPGLDFITEGIAYEIERAIRIKGGESRYEVDLDTPSFPYLAYGPLVESIAGRELSSDVKVFIGSMALLTSNPSAALYNLSELHKYADGTPQSKILEAYVNNIVYQFEEYAEYVRSSIIPMFRNIFSKSSVLDRGMQVYERLIIKALASRIKYKCIELAFLNQPMDEKGFTNASVNILERIIFQGKPNFASEIKWVGQKGSVASMPREMHEAFSVLQASIHYAQHHLTATHIETTERLMETACPFTGACTVEHDAGRPDACRRTPWSAKSSGDIKVLCTYQAGIEALQLTLLEDDEEEEDDPLPF